ncbi:hypothetical protein ORL23_12075 [Kluyvera cryocrescens]|uniref:hypothetical protein n=1 Tax=Kluyvera cryocrescens TaxID=580 RepID=UPI00224AEC50|nr:hypothetical protein [Kluyvera cryocrescens]MCX2868219.1 hypothetical protein [Kluyvera cryocrescens]
MSLFQTINNEKNELVHFETLIYEISQQERVSFSDVCAVIAREATWHLDDVPFYEPFFLYDYDVINGFKKNDDFSYQSIEFLKSMAFGAEYAEDANPDSKGIYSRIDGESGWHRAFYFKGTEVTISFLDSGVNIPPCLEKFRVSAEKRLKIKNDKLVKEYAKEDVKEVSKGDLEKEIEQLKSEIERLISNTPSNLGVFRVDDPLLIAIQIRNSEWSGYDEDDRKTIPSQEALVAQLKQQYKNMPDAQARAIEKVACPIKRK